jgi:hydrogenase maturation protease
LSRKIAVIGLGNTLRRDDGIGIMILESLLNFYKRKGLDYLNFGSASFDLLHRLKVYDKALLIDGVDAGLCTGELLISELKDIEYKLDDFVTSTHALNLKRIFELSKNLSIKTKIYVAGIQVGDTSFGEGLSESLNNKLEEILQKIKTFIDENFIRS